MPPFGGFYGQWPDRKLSRCLEQMGLVSQESRLAN